MGDFDQLIFDAATVDIDEAVATFKKYKCIQLNNAFKKQDIENILRDLDRVRVPGSGGHPLMDHFYSSCYSPEDLEFPMVNLLRTAPLYSILTSAFDGRAISIPAHHCSHIRFVEALPPDENGHYYSDVNAEPYHQDSKACDLNVFGDMIIVWFLLTPQRSGKDVAPTLKLLPGDVDYLCPIESNPDHPKSGALEISHDWVQQSPDHLGEWIPELTLGDAIVFSGMCPHGTHVSGAMKQNRLSCELKMYPHEPPLTDRFYASGDHFPDYFYISDRFTVGPIAVNNIEPATERYELRRTELDGYTHFDVEFRTGRIRDDQEFSVRNTNRTECVSDAIDRISFVFLQQSAIWQLIQVFGEESNWNHIGIDIDSLPKGTDSTFDVEIFDGIGSKFNLDESGATAYVTMLQNPLDRCIRDFLRWADLVNEENFIQYLNARESYSVLSGQLANIRKQAGLNPGQTTSDSRVCQAKTTIHHLETMFSQVLVADYFAESAFLLADYLGRPKIQLPRTYQYNDPRINADSLGQHTIDLLHEKVDEDISIYGYFREKLQKSCKNADFGQPLANYREDYYLITDIVSHAISCKQSRRNLLYFEKLLENFSHEEEPKFYKKNGQYGFADLKNMVGNVLCLRQNEGQVVNQIPRFQEELARKESRIKLLEQLTKAQEQQIERMQNVNTEMLKKELGLN